MNEELYKIDGKEINYDEIDIKQYESLEEESEKINRWKVKSLLFLFVLVVSQSIYHSIPWYGFGTDNVFLSIIVAVVAYILNIIIAYLLHKKAYYKVSKGGKIFNLKFPFFKKNLISISYFLLSPDYFFAREYKENIKKSHINCCYKSCNSNCLKDRNGMGICLKSWDGIKIDLKYFINYSNWYNVILATSIAAVTIFFWGYSGWLIDILFYITVFRILSRFIEISVAFYKDVTRVDDKVFADSKGDNQIYIHNWKNSLLLKSSRISLAIHSLVEIIILFSMLYYFISINFLGTDGVDKLKETIGSPNGLNTYNFLLFSLSVSAFNFSFTSFESLIWGTVHVLQVILSLVLIILALATYLSITNNLLERDKKLYLKIAIKKLKREKN